jgi:hypothetical protein
MYERPRGILGKAYLPTFVIIVAIIVAAWIWI